MIIHINKILEALLRLKSWQLFLLFISPALFLNVPIINIVLCFLWLGGYIAWIYSAGAKMYALLPADLFKPSIIYFKYKCLLLAIVILTYAIILGRHSPAVFLSPKYIVIIIALLPIYLYLNFSICSFSGRMLESVIVGRMVSVSESFKAIFCFWFFPIGIWYVQPAIKIVLQRHSQKNHPNDLE
jgi:hypothetical protein